MASLLTSRRECQCCKKGDGACSGEVVVITTSLSIEVFVRCGPMIEEGSPHELLVAGTRLFSLWELERAGWEWRSDDAGTRA